jgi:hypothetical protein
MRSLASSQARPKERQNSKKENHGRKSKPHNGAARKQQSGGEQEGYAGENKFANVDAGEHLWDKFANVDETEPDQEKQEKGEWGYDPATGWGWDPRVQNYFHYNETTQEYVYYDKNNVRIVGGAAGARSGGRGGSRGGSERGRRHSWSCSWSWSCRWAESGACGGGTSELELALKFHGRATSTSNDNADSTIASVIASGTS